MAATLDRTSTEDADSRQLEARAGDFAVEVVRGDGYETVVVSGELYGGTAPLLGGVLDTVYARRPQRLEVDLSGLTFLAADTAGALVAVHRRLGRGADLVLLHPSPAVHRVLAAIGLARMVVNPDDTARSPSD